MSASEITRQWLVQGRSGADKVGPLLHSSSTSEQTSKHCAPTTSRSEILHNSTH